MSVTGKDLQRPATLPSVNNSQDLRRWVAAEWQVVKECIPGASMSDEAVALYLNELMEIATQIGPESFHEVVLRILKTCERRPTIATFRRVASLSIDIPSPASLAWVTVTKVTRFFLARDGNGNAYVSSRTRIVDGKAVTEEPPPLTEGMRQAVLAMGGWTALANCDPEWWPQRFQTFKELLHESSTALTKVP